MQGYFIGKNRDACFSLCLLEKAEKEKMNLTWNGMDRVFNFTSSSLIEIMEYGKD